MRRHSLAQNSLSYRLDTSTQLCHAKAVATVNNTSGKLWCNTALATVRYDYTALVRKAFATVRHVCTALTLQSLSYKPDTSVQLWRDTAIAIVWHVRTTLTRQSLSYRLTRSDSHGAWQSHCYRQRYTRTALVRQSHSYRQRYARTAMGHDKAIATANDTPVQLWHGKAIATVSNTPIQLRARQSPSFTDPHARLCMC